MKLISIKNYWCLQDNLSTIKTVSPMDPFASLSMAKNLLDILLYKKRGWKMGKGEKLSRYVYEISPSFSVFSMSWRILLLFLMDLEYPGEIDPMITFAKTTKQKIDIQWWILIYEFTFWTSGKQLRIHFLAF